MSNHRHCKHYFESKSVIEQKDGEIAELKKRLQYYENSNSPPSANSLLWKKRKKERKMERIRNGTAGEPKKPGRRNGHQGVSHSFKPAETIEHTLQSCAGCGSSDISFSHQECRLILDVPEPQPCTVTMHRISIYGCRICSSRVRPHVDIPETGDLGKNLLAMITALWSEARLPVGRIRAMLMALYGLKLSTATINKALVNVSGSLQPLVNRVKSNINRSKSAGFDETGISINGKKGWIWCAVSGNGKNAFIAVENSRGADVLEKHFYAFDGIAIVDGWKAYSIFRQQRCWAHIIREADAVALRTEDDKAKELASSLKLLYHDIKAELKEHPPPNRSLYRKAMNRLREIIGKRYRNYDVKKFLEKLRNAGRNLFTFVMHNVDSTNNAAERVLREVVIHRKIRGLLRNEKGMKMFGNIMTAVMTWNSKGLNPVEQVRKYL